jgi:hypothetical protein
MIFAGIIDLKRGQMFVVELFLPLETSDGRSIPSETFERIKTELTERFGGVTSFLRSPAEGAWKPSGGSVVHDQVAIFEVMVEDVDTAWWHQYRKGLEREFDQAQILARLYQVTVL